MHKLISIIMAAILTLLFTSCIDGMPSMIFSNEGTIADSYFKKIVEAIENKDSEAIKKLFSKKAVYKAKELDGSIEYLFSLLEGDIVSWENDKWSAGTSSRKNGSNRMIRAWYNLTTTEGEYMFILLIYDKDTIDRDNKGLYTLRGIDRKNIMTQWSDWVTMEVPGVYWPETAGGPHPLVDNS